MLRSITKQLNELLPSADLIERRIINSIKIERIDICDVWQKQNIVINKFIKSQNINLKNPLIIQQEKELKQILEKQWDLLDISYDEKKNKKERMKSAFEAQLLNVNRIKCKNRISEIIGQPLDQRTYS